jgi:hypothetical protein
MMRINQLFVVPRSGSRPKAERVIACQQAVASLVVEREAVFPKARRPRRQLALLVRVFVLVAAQMATFPSATAGPLVLARDQARTIDLSTFAGQTYLQAVLAPVGGIDVKTATDDTTTVTIASTGTILAAFGTFDPDVAQRLYSHFKNGQTDFVSAASHIAGENVSPLAIQNMLSPFLINIKGDTRGATMSASDLILLTSGSGTVVMLNADDYFYNVAYQTPTTSSGRSYAVTSTRNLLDATDNYYLKELAAYLTSGSNQQVSDFYTALVKLLTASDASGVSTLNASGQVVLTDFMAVYTAELMRHNMAHLDVNTKPWETDLGEVTLLSAYIAASGRVMDGGKLVAGDPTSYAQNGSIGTHRADFTKLAKLITAYEKGQTAGKALITTVNTLTPVGVGTIASSVSGDVFRRALVFVDQPQFETSVQANAGGLTTAIVQLLLQIRADQSAITTYVLSHQ